MAHLQIHAMRYGDTPEERDRTYFNHQPALVPVAPDDEVVITLRNNVAYIRVNGADSLSIVLHQYDHTALALCWGDKPEPPVSI